MTTFTLAQYDEAAAYIRSRTRHTPTIGLVLGSGLGPLAEQIAAQFLLAMIAGNTQQAPRENGTDAKPTTH